MNEMLAKKVRGQIESQPEITTHLWGESRREPAYWEKAKMKHLDHPKECG